MPLKVFSLYNTNINRLRAEEELRLMRVFASTNDGGVLASVQASLQEELGKVAEYEGNAFVPMEEGAADKLMGMING